LSSEITIFAVVFVAAILFFVWSCYKRFRLVLLGKADYRFDKIGKRIGNMLYYAFGQRRVVSRPFGINHFVLFWCFMVLLIANAEFLLHGLFPDYISISLLPDGLYFVLACIFDVVSILALLSVLVALGRRIFFPPKYIEARTRDAFIILSMVALLMIAFFGLHGSEIVLSAPRSDMAAHKMMQAAQFMPVSKLVSIWLTGVSIGTLEWLSKFFWWLHAVVLLTFLNYLPYSKHMHILTSIFNCFFKNIDKVTTQTPEEFKKGNSFGAGSVDLLRWKDLFDSYSCTECGRCNDMCPATNTGKELNPRLVVHDIKVNLIHNGPGLARKEEPTIPLIAAVKEGSVSEASIWACTTCAACMEVCPVFIEHVPKLIYMRRHLVEMQAKFPTELLTFFENIEQRSNPWGIAPSERVKWATDITVKPFENGKTEYLFYIGCFGAFDSRSRRVTLAIANILDAAGISWGILGKDELCCGDSLRRLGNEFVFDQLAKANVKMFKDRGVKKIITECPHCYNTLKNDYKQYGADQEVIHHSDFINDLIQNGKLKLSLDKSLGRVMMHDSCYLGRYNEIYLAPRKAIEAATGKPPMEMERHHDKSFCCGAGGGRMWMEENVGTRININRVEEALRHDPETLCVCCPYCMTMFEDGLKDKKSSGTVKVLDVAEIVAGALKKS
jgi:Fe-S oxidoreductase